jgi:SpoVK/Ycf46/Vps4 family AAA+-type ATPase
MGAPTEEQRFSILKSLSKKVPSLAKLDMDSVAKRTPGYVGQDLIRVAHLAILKSYVSSAKLNVLE